MAQGCVAGGHGGCSDIPTIVWGGTPPALSGFKRLLKESVGCSVFLRKPGVLFKGLLTPSEGFPSLTGR